MQIYEILKLQTKRFFKIFAKIDQVIDLQYITNYVFSFKNPTFHKFETIYRCTP